jgi:hypothetical protein
MTMFLRLEKMKLIEVSDQGDQLLRLKLLNE